jgi:hypothetical protein
MADDKISLFACPKRPAKWPVFFLVHPKADATAGAGWTLFN